MLDSVLTLSERSLGVMQPRPVTTLHVGGPITADGLITGKAGLHVDGPITTGGGGLTLGDLTTSNLTVTPGNASVAGSLSAGSITTGTLTVSGTVSASVFSWTSRAVSAVPWTYGIANSPGGQGPMEVGVSGGGAAMIAFHRHGAYAAHFGLDTDNQWAVGGWSMGAVRYVLYHSGHFTYSVTPSAYTLVQREGNGYIQASYINTTADIQGGAPVYVAGQNGDNYIRWYPKASLATPALRTYGFFGAQSHASNATINRTTGITSNQAGVTHDGTSIYVQKAGYYAIYARSGASDNTWDLGRYQEMRIMTSGGNATGFVTECPKGGSGSHVTQYTVVHLPLNGQVYFQVFQNSGYTINYDTGFWDLWYLPS